MLLATFQAHCIASQGVAVQCVCVCVPHSNYWPQELSFGLCCYYWQTSRTYFGSALLSPSTSSRRTQPTISTQPERDPHNYKTISPQLPLLCCLPCLMQGLLSHSSPALLVSTTRTTSAAGTATAYWLIFTVYPQFARGRRRRGPSEPCLKATERGQSFINSRLAKSTRPCAAIHQTALASVTQLHLCCCCLWASSFVWFILQLLQASSQAFGAYSCGLHTEREEGGRAHQKINLTWLHWS